MSVIDIFSRVCDFYQENPVKERKQSNAEESGLSSTLSSLNVVCQCKHAYATWQKDVSAFVISGWMQVVILMGFYHSPKFGDNDKEVLQN